MLYIWPYFAFFSIPILYHYFLDITISYQLLPSSLALNPQSSRSRFPRLIVAVPTMVFMTAIVHFNTIVHPFTLADNRHYMFYVFRLLLRHPIIKYLAVPIYFICAWATLTALGGLYRQVAEPPKSKTASKKKKQQASKASDPSDRSEEAPGNRVSFLLIWLLATTLSLATAPLVEPRYLIVPWLTWRLHIATPRQRDNSSGYDPRLWLETAWFLVINMVTGYIFLYWGFEWLQEPGMVQRFMW